MLPDVVPPTSSPPNRETPLRHRLYVIIFEHDTWGGKAFDVALLLAVGLSVLAVTLESVDTIRADYGTPLRAAEWLFTAVFTVEYVLRLYSAKRRLRYAFSFFGIVDLLAAAPTYASVIFPGAQSFLALRVLRLLRAFQVLKLVRLYRESDTLMRALRASGPKITVFIGTVLCIVVVVGAAMYFVEGPAHGFRNIPVSIYWAIVTLTTVGFGDITPQTPLGQIIASTLMILGYGIIAVPTGIVSAEMVRSTRAGGSPSKSAPCSACGLDEHQSDAAYCRSCGTSLGAKEPGDVDAE